ncbi:GNAT family N-acetyltransferase [Phytoactinopolyspora endophytica]|uniref:GNAT family N-acetyltransferase n=1 Tax=Phytoactinopolyspora endophytica TaxID=1642495 RepID=UPI0013ED349E|nr:GNAT family N-acetyltransferase [Phytoactinopolyspora endophytica]
MNTTTLTVRPLTPDAWDDFETVMGTAGGSRGCWCMHWRLSIAEWMEEKGDGNKAAMRALADRETTPGVVGYLGDEPVAWCAFGDRSEFPRMQRSSLLKPVDEKPVVSLTCLLIRKDYRGEGLSTELIAAVCTYLDETSETRTIEAYPVEPVAGRRAGPDTAMTGLASTFIAAGFSEVARPKPDRPVMRYDLP